MKLFTSFEGFAGEVLNLAVALPLEEHNILEHACKEIEKLAKEKIGEYQQEAGPFSAWQPLADATKRDRVNKGFPEDEPLLRTGDMRDTIEHKVEGSVGHVGSDSDIALWQELGTDKIPARSFLGGSAFEMEPKIREETGIGFTALLSGGSQKVKAV